MEREPRIRWLWAYDPSGQRVTQPEPVGFVDCPACRNCHPIVADVIIGIPAGVGPDRVLRLAPIAGQAVQLAGFASSEFYPEED